MTAAELKTSKRPPPAAFTTEPYAPPIAWWVPLREWRGRYPQSARMLDEWRASYPACAQRLVAWNAQQPENFEVLVFWRMTHPYEPLGSFFASRHGGWTELSALAASEPEAIKDFLLWIWASGPAAEELAVHRGALTYVLRASGEASGATAKRAGERF